MTANPAEARKLRLDFTPSEMGMVMGVGFRLEPDLKEKWDALLARVVYIEPITPSAPATATAREDEESTVALDDRFLGLYQGIELMRLTADTTTKATDSKRESVR